ncbi:hypothetical protein ACFXAF_14245 [Kitasatospora sp. NPDC059463]|uniref:hypothetical protein n=1 Tax=unclassified Kitasatospora TaxID=2633591 RepID=UPI0036A7A53B
MVFEAGSEKEGPGPRFVEIDPELAKELVSRVSVNRRLDQGYVDALAEAMRRGEWRVTHQGIALDGPLDSGSVLDGQHRLHAIVKSRCTVWLYVFEDMPRDIFPVLDTGKRRSGADALSSTGEKYLPLFFSTIRHVLLFKSMPDSSWSGIRAQVTNGRILGAYWDETDRYRLAVATGRSLSKHIAASQTAAAVGYFLTTEAAPGANAGIWIEGLVSGANLGLGDPRLALPKALKDMQKRGSRRRAGIKDQVAAYIKAWNAWVEDRPINNPRLLRLKKNEKMPMPVVRV